MKKCALRRLRAVALLVESDVGSDADFVAYEVCQGRPVTPREKEFAELITQIYTLVHPHFSDCPHKDWEKENEKLMKQADESYEA